MWMKSTRILILLAVCFLIIGAGYMYFTQKSKRAVIMPTPSAPDSVTLPMGSTGRIGDVFLTFNKLVQDSRCPAGVMCIQAGSVTANITLVSGSKNETFNLPQDEVPHEFGGYQVSITGVEPLRRQHGEIAQSEYVLTLSALPFIRSMYLCDLNRSITATYAGEEVHLTLLDAVSNERQLYLSRVISASGARYSNGDESFVFWNKGDTAFVTEQDGKTTFANCLEKN